MGSMEDLDFTSGSAKSGIYDPAVARACFQSLGKVEIISQGGNFFIENQGSDRMYLLIEGEVSLFRGKKALDVVKAGEIFGEMAAISDSPRSASAVARSACRVIALDDKQFYAALQKKPEFALMMLGTLIQRLHGMIAKLSGVPTAETKESRVFDKKLLASLQAGLGDQAMVRYDRGKVIMVAGQTGALMYVVLEGRVAISIRGAVIERVGPGGVFGEMALVDQSPRSANAAAEADCALLAINRAVFLSLVKSDPTFGISLLSSMAERVRNTAAGSS